MRYTHTLSVVIPTRGRPTLVSALESLVGLEGIKTIVVEDTFDTEKPEGYLDTKSIHSLCKSLSAYHVYFNAGYSDWGYPQTELAYRHMDIGGQYVMNIGDDDVMIRDAIPKLLQILDNNNMIPFMFQAVLHPSPHRGNRKPVILWNDENRSIERKWVTGQNLVLPNIPCLMGQMVDDFEFIRQTIELWHGNVKWIPIPIVDCF